MIDRQEARSDVARIDPAADRQTDLETIIAAIIQAMWLIDENAMIFRNLVWLNPIIVLVNRDIAIIDIIN
jgi:hypothetical protein